jgi:glyoxylase-like metal-dependent hydrolase (beta-lactamase superfamily II)/rhodanese-related sulfurtransferase
MNMTTPTRIRNAFSAILVSVSVIGGAPTGAAPAGDAEAAKHGTEASQLAIVTRDISPGFTFIQFDLSVLSHYSYLLGSDGEAMVIDPARDVDVYLKTAAELGLKITRVYLTHSHADFVAGHTELAKATGAAILVNQRSEVAYAHTGLADNATFSFGSIRAVVRHTPGHTPDGTCLFIYSPADSATPQLALTGDTLFIGSVGRPDLMGGSHSAAELAGMIYRTWNDILSRVPDTTKIYPAHGAGSLCGAHLSDANVSTFGEQKVSNPYLQYKDLTTFVMAVLDGLPPAPQYFAHNAAMNIAGPPLVNWTRKTPDSLDPAEVAKKAAKGVWLIDLRDPGAFAAGHVPGSVNIPVRGRFETWTGIMIPWGEPFLLVGSDDEVAEATFRLHRVGYDEPVGYLKGNVAAWQQAGKEVGTVKLVKPQDLSAQIRSGTAPVLVDVRLPREWAQNRIAETLLNMPLNELPKQRGQLDPGMPVATVCNSAYRSSLGASMLLRAGFREVWNLEGGTEAWMEAGMPTYGSGASHPVTPPSAGPVDLPERIGPQELARQLTDLPGSFEVVDIRPTWQYAEYHVPGAVNASPSDVMVNPAYLTGKIPLVIVCRDGTISAAVGGAIAGKTERSIRFLVGGVTAYYDEVMRPIGIQADNRPQTPSILPNPAGASIRACPPPPPPGPAPKPAEAPATPPPPKKQAKKPSAGC